MLLYYILIIYYIIFNIHNNYLFWYTKYCILNGFTNWENLDLRINLGEQLAYPFIMCIVHM